MKNLILAAFLITSPLAFAGNTYKPVKVIKAEYESSASVLDVKFLTSKLVAKISDDAHRENLFVVAELGVEAVASSCETFSDIKIDRVQHGRERSFDMYFSIPAKSKKGCATGSYGEPKLLSFEIETLVNSRNISELGKPWGPPSKFLLSPTVKFLSFRKEMAGGIDIWGLYKLDVEDNNNVKFEFLKNYSYVQGEVD